MQNTFLPFSWLSVARRGSKTPSDEVFRGAEHNGEGLKPLSFTVCEILYPILFLPISWVSLARRGPEMTISQFSGVLNTMVKV